MMHETDRIEKAKRELQRLSKEIDDLKARAREEKLDRSVNYMTRMKKIDKAYGDALNGILRIQQWAAGDATDTVQDVQTTLDRLEREIRKARVTFH